MSGTFVNKLRAILLSAICLLFSFQMNNSLTDVDLMPQIKKLTVEQIIEYEDHLYQHRTVSNLPPSSVKKRSGPGNKQSNKQ